MSSVYIARRNLAARRIQALARGRRGRANSIFLRRRTGARSGAAQAAAGGAVRPARGNTRAVVMSRNLRSNEFMPARIETCMSNVLDMYYPIGTMTAAAGNYFDIQINSMFPWNNTTYTPTAAPGLAYANHATLVQGGSIAQGMMGYAQLGALYANYRVVAYELEIICGPQTSADSTRVVVVPLGDEQIPAVGAGSVDLRVMETQPYAKSKTFYQGLAPIGGPILRLTGNPAADIGKTYTQYMSQDDTGTAGIPDINTTDYVGIFLQQLNGANNTGVVTLQLKLMQRVVWYGLIEPTN